MSDSSSPADTHDLIRVQGARENNLKDVSVELPKRRLTVFTGVSGSGKSSLVFGTIAAESQRMINETYSAFVQGFMPTLARPDVDLLDGLTTAIIVDQERMGANPRSTVGTATDANAMLRILFSRLGQPHIGSPKAFSFNVASISGRGASPSNAAARKTSRSEKRVLDHRRHVPALRGHGRGHRLRPHRALRRQQVAQRGRAHDPRLQHGRAGTAGSSRGSGFFDPDKPIREYTKKELHDLLHKEPTKIKVDGHQPHLRGPHPQDPEVVPLQGRRGDAAAHPGLRRAGGHLHHLPRVRGTRLNEAARSSKIAGINIADACAMQISDLADVGGGLDEPSVAPLLASLRHTLDSFVEIGLGYLSLDRPTGTLSGGEAQRTKMIRHLGSSLTDVTYVFDEPTIGLHPHDIQRMNELLLRLRDKGNTVLVVEHKPEVIAIADHVVDLGPGAGDRRRRGGLRGVRRGAAGERHAHRAAPGRPRLG
jgi:excinuclease UvrABC ATPase subunit